MAAEADTSDQRDPDARFRSGPKSAPEGPRTWSGARPENRHLHLFLDSCNHDTLEGGGGAIASSEAPFGPIADRVGRN